MFTGVRPVREHDNKKIPICSRLENYSHYISDCSLMSTIVESPPLSWIEAIDKIYHKHKSMTTYVLAAWLEEEEGKLNPL